MSARQVLKQLRGRELEVVAGAVRRVREAAAAVHQAARDAKAADDHLLELLTVAGVDDPEGVRIDPARGIIYRELPTEVTP